MSVEVNPHVVYKYVWKLKKTYECREYNVPGSGGFHDTKITPSFSCMLDRIKTRILTVMAVFCMSFVFRHFSSEAIA